MPRGPSKVIGLTFLLYRCQEDPRKFVAHCLELDVVAVEGTKPQAIDLLKELVDDLFQSAQDSGTLDKVFRPAPLKFWAMLARSKRYEPPARVVQHHISAASVRTVGYALAADE